MQTTFLGLTRLALGLIFLWAFIDKVFGLGFATEAGKAWIDGVSPTAGYLSFATYGPLAGIFQAMSGNTLVDILFMLGLLGVGTGLALGIKVKISSSAGIAMLTLMYLSALPPEHHPLIDEHIVYILILASFIATPEVGGWIGLGKWWSKHPLVKKYPGLQ
jgi:thiosulfate dehydrogenase (quinone) large subunit